jgi:hypothetical protein
MNTFRRHTDGSWLANARGYYIEGTEDQLTPSLFETFTVLPVAAWVPAIMSRQGVQVAGTVKRARWCYAFEDPNASRGFRIADIVLCWEDDAGQAILVIEAKRPGTMPGAKDLPDSAPYLEMPSLRKFQRRYYCLLVGDAQRSAAQQLTQEPQKIITWGDLMSIQISAADAATTSAELRFLLRAAIKWNSARCGVGRSSSTPSAHDDASGTRTAYDRIRSLDAPTAIEHFLIGVESCAAAHRGIMPEPPLEYLRNEPSSLDVYLRGKQHAAGYQTTADRRISHWKLTGDA